MSDHEPTDAARTAAVVLTSAPLLPHRAVASAWQVVLTRTQRFLPLSYCWASPIWCGQEADTVSWKGDERRTACEGILPSTEAFETLRWPLAWGGSV